MVRPGNSSTNDSWPVNRGRWFLGRMLSRSAPDECSVLGLRFKVARGVFSPCFSRSSAFFARELRGRCKGKTLCEVGCGTGVVGIHCAVGGAKAVVCTDVNALAVRCTRENAVRHGVERRVHVIKGDAFSGISARFDVVFFALPYVYVQDVEKLVRKYGSLAHAVFDERYKSQRQFLAGAGNHLAVGGELYVGFSNVGSEREFHLNLDRSRYVGQVVAREKEGRADNQLIRLERDAALQ